MSGTQSNTHNEMKLLFDHSLPFLLAHGGFQIQIEQTKAALQALGLNVEHLRWWDNAQKGQIIHYFGRPLTGYVDLAHSKGLKIVVSELLTGLGSRTPAQRVLQKLVTRATRSLVPKAFTMRQGWGTFQTADALVALTSWEAYLLADIFQADPNKIHVVPNGVERAFFEAKAEERGLWLVCTATITERKRVLETAEAAVAANVPLWIIGKPYSQTSDYFLKFKALHERYPTLIRYQGAIDDRHELARAYRQARGFVLLSTMESLSLSALEAAACRCPLLLSDLPWARSVFGDQVRYCSVTASKGQTAASLHQFYDHAQKIAPPSVPLTWTQVAQQLLQVYERLLKA